MIKKFFCVCRLCFFNWLGYYRVMFFSIYRKNVSVKGKLLLFWYISEIMVGGIIVILKRVMRSFKICIIVW